MIMLVAIHSDLEKVPEERRCSQNDRANSKSLQIS